MCSGCIIQLVRVVRAVPISTLLRHTPVETPCAVQKIERFNTFFYRTFVEVYSHAGKRYSCHQNLNWHGPGEANAKSRHGHGHWPRSDHRSGNTHRASLSTLTWAGCFSLVAVLRAAIHAHTPFY